MSILLWVLISSLATHAATFIVSQLGDSGVGSLRQALLDANSAGNNHSILFSVSGTIQLGSNLPTITNSISIQGNGQSVTLDGGNQYKVFEVGTAVSSFSLTELTVVHGLDNSFADGGGALYAGFNTNVTLTDCNFIGNESAFEGGAVSIRGGSGTTIRVEACIFLGNVAADEGGGLYINNSDQVELIRNTFTQNEAERGGALYLGGSNALISGCSFRLNQANSLSIIGGNGGGAYLAGSRDCQMETCSFEANESTNEGGGIYLAGGGTSKFTGIDCVFSTNRSNDDGGAIYFAGGGSLTNSLNGCTFDHNEATGNGAGIYVSGGGTHTYTMLNCTLSQNATSTGRGGGIYLSSGGFQLSEIRHCTIYNNTAQNGGGVATASDLRLINSILARSVGSPDLWLQGSTPQLVMNVHNIVQTCTGTNCPSFYTTVDPQLGPLQNNGGPTYTHQLLSTSPALDAGDPSYSPTPNVDQRGTNRDALPDIGGFEGVGPAPVTLVGFSGRQVDSGILLSWETASELENRGFSIERRSDGHIWQSIGWVAGMGTTDMPQAYTFLDAFVPKQQVLYRLKQIDWDGVYAYSHTLAITLASTPWNLQLYQPPLTDRLYLSVKGYPSHIDFPFRITDLQGRTVQAGKYHQAGIDISTLVPGSYLCTLRLPTKILRKRIILNRN